MLIESTYDPNENQNPLGGDQRYWSAWAPALSKANWSITTGWLELMKHDWCCPTAIINTSEIPTSLWVNVQFSSDYVALYVYLVFPLV